MANFFTYCCKVRRFKIQARTYSLLVETHVYSNGTSKRKNGSANGLFNSQHSSIMGLQALPLNLKCMSLMRIDFWLWQEMLVRVTVNQTHCLFIDKYILRWSFG